MKTQPIKTLLLLSALIIMFTACSQDDEVTYQLNSTAVQLYPGKTFTLEVQPASTGWSFSSKNSNIASVTDSGVVTTHYVGTTMIYVRHAVGQFVDSVQVTVKPKITAFRDPYLGFYSTEETVRNNESGTFISLSSGEGHEGGYALRYNVDESYNIIYHFNVANAYDYSEVILSSLYDEDVNNHVSERYLFLREKNFTYKSRNYIDKHYISPDSTKLICVTYSSDSQFTHFHPYTVQAMEAIQNDTVGRVFVVI